MATSIPGQGNERIKLMSVCKDAPVILHATLSGGTLLDTSGRHMHLSYVPAELKVVAPSKGNLVVTLNADPEIRFDARGSHVLNWEGEVYLTGGNPADTYSLTAWWEPAKKQKKHKHWLTTFCNGAAPLQVPEYHSLLRSATSLIGVDFTSGGFSGTLSDVPISLWGSATITFRAPCTVQTGWFG